MRGPRRHRSTRFALLVCIAQGGAVWAAAGAAVARNHVLCRTLSKDVYELTVTVQSTTDVFAAQDLLIPEARRICGGKLFQLGRYSFASTENIKAASGSPAPPSRQLTLKQEVECGPAATTPSAHTSYDWVPADADSQLVAARTREYLGQKDAGELAQAYSQFSDSLKATSPFDGWSRSAASVNAKEGAVKARRILKVSWVKDPPGVDPGFYAAVDYAGEFRNANYECGYVAWYREPSGRLTIVREEEGYIDRETEKKMTPDALRYALAKIGCVGG
jgi:hypothetical protein